jgi:hypothetical protein
MAQPSQPAPQNPRLHVAYVTSGRHEGKLVVTIVGAYNSYDYSGRYMSVLDVAFRGKATAVWHAGEGLPGHDPRVFIDLDNTVHIFPAGYLFRGHLFPRILRAAAGLEDKAEGALVRIREEERLWVISEISKITSDGSDSGAPVRHARSVRTVGGI